MKKVLCLIDKLSFGGGAERQMAGLACFLSQKGYDVTLASYLPHNCSNLIRERYGLTPVILETKKNRLSKLQAVAKFIKKENFEVVIAYKDGVTMLCCLLKMFGLKSKVIVSERNTTQNLTIRERFKFFLYRRADHVVTNSHTQGNFIKGSFPKLSTKTFVITNYTDTGYFKPMGKNNFIPGCNTEKRKIIKILVTARIAKQKNVLGFMRAVKKLKEQRVDLEIKWYGSVYMGQEGYGEECKRLYDDLSISDVLTFYPATSDILIAYQNCDVFCLPSFYEGYPNVVCEAMSCGKPILCSRVCDNPYIVKEGVNGLMFNPFDTQDIVHTIMRMCQLSDRERLEMGERNLKVAEKLFSSETFVQKYIELIEKR